MQNPFRYFNFSPEIIRLTVMLYIRYPLSLRQVEDILHERGIDICHETVRLWWNRFGPLFAAEIRKRRVHHHRYSLWRWHLDEGAPRRLPPWSGGRAARKMRVGPSKPTVRGRLQTTASCDGKEPLW